MPVEVGTLLSHRSFVGNGALAAGTTLMFCNGIANPEMKDAEAGAKIVSNAFNRCRVEVFHNTTSPSNILERTWEEKKAQKKLSLLFAKAIVEQITLHKRTGVPANQIRVLLFVHSHGATLLKRALKSIKENDYLHLHVYSLGGAQLLPRCLGAVVKNYIYREDLISSIGNILTSKDGTKSQKALEDIKHVDAIVSQGETLENAIFLAAYRDLFAHLNPFRPTDYNEPLALVQKKPTFYERIFKDQDFKALQDSAYFSFQKTKYLDLFIKYNVSLLSGTSFQRPSLDPVRQHANLEEFMGNLPGNLFTTLGNLFKEIYAIGEHVYSNHTMHSYAPVVNEIAFQYDYRT